MTILRFVATCATLVALATAAQAQQVYRIVGPDGKVTFSDRAPSGGAEAAQAGSGQRGQGAPYRPDGRAEPLGDRRRRGVRAAAVRVGIVSEGDQDEAGLGAELPGSCGIQCP